MFTSVGVAVELFVKITLGVAPCGFPHNATEIAMSPSWDGRIKVEAEENVETASRLSCCCRVSAT